MKEQQKVSVDILKVLLLVLLELQLPLKLQKELQLLVFLLRLHMQKEIKHLHSVQVIQLSLLTVQEQYKQLNYFHLNHTPQLTGMIHRL